MTPSITDSLPEHLKDPSCYGDVMEKLAATLYTTHKHKTFKAYDKCTQCGVQRENKNKLMKELGFESFAQYLQWKKIMDIIINKHNV